MKRFLLLTASGVTSLSIPLVAFAHGLGSQFVLPLPASFYILGGASALTASFAILALYSSPSSGNGLRTLSKPLPGQFRAVWNATTGAGLVFFFLTLATGALGSQLFYENPAPIFFWSITLLWFAYANALFGGLWEKLNPFKTIAAWTLKGTEPLFTYPKKLGYFPAILFYYIIMWVELFSGSLAGSAVFLSIALQVYLLLTLLGVFLFGEEKWFTYGDFFSVFFGVIGKFAPLSLERERVSLSLPGERLIHTEEKEPTLILFILFFLASTAFDGLRETSAWVDLILSLPRTFSIHFSLISQMILFLSPFIFYCVYLSTAWAMKKISGDLRSATEIGLRFIPSFVPIAITYSIAHYAGVLFIDVQYLIPLLSDPFALGWNLFNTADYSVNIAPLSAQALWNLQISAIIFGHVLSAYIAHRIARCTFTTKQAVIRGQLPMMALMVFYTVFGLWILSEPYALPTW